MEPDMPVDCRGSIQPFAHFIRLIHPRAIFRDLQVPHMFSRLRFAVKGRPDNGTWASQEQALHCCTEMFRL
jgi:hypothetical protein